LAEAFIGIGTTNSPIELDDILHVAKKERRVERNYTIAKTAILVRISRGSRRTLRSIRDYTGSTIRGDSHVCAVDGSTDRNQPWSKRDYGIDTKGIGRPTFKFNGSRQREQRSNDGNATSKPVAGSSCCSFGTGKALPQSW